MKNYYGLNPMSFEEEANAPENIKITRDAKVSIINNIDRMRKYLDTIEFRARETAEIDDDAHASFVLEWYAMVSGLAVDLENASTYGII